MPQISEQINLESITSAAAEIVKLGRSFYTRGWNLATSSNYSAVVSNSPLRLIMTASGKHKGELSESDFVIVNEAGALENIPGYSVDSTLKPSAEAALHVALAKHKNAGAILHTHSVWSTIISERFFANGYVEICGFEMLKALPGIVSHEQSVRIAVLDNTQDMNWLAQEISKKLDAGEIEHAFLLRGHGLYTWGATIAQTRNQVEALEFLFEVIGRTGEQ